MTELVLGGPDGPRYSLDDAEAALVGYAFATDDEPDRKRRRPAYGPPVELDSRPRWGYRTYDCIRPSPGPSLSDLDLLVASGLNARLDVDAVAGLMAARGEADEALSELDEGLTFWSLDASAVSTAKGAGPVKDSQSWFVHRAWEALMSAPHVGTTTAHKVLHHKRPAVFPLLDRKTLAGLPAGEAWLTVYHDVTGQVSAFEELADRFAKVADRHEGARLTRLRIHDILLWLALVGQSEQAQEAGRAVLAD